MANKQRFHGRDFANRFCLPLLATALLVSASTTAHAEDATSYLCIAEKGSGFKFNTSNQTWEHARFNVSESKYILSKSQGVWTWKRVGQKHGITCSENFNESGYMHCTSFDQVTMNRKTLRFLLVYPVGYVNVGIAGKEGEDTPSMEIGKCSSLQ